MEGFLPFSQNVRTAAMSLEPKVAGAEGVDFVDIPNPV